MSDVLRWKLLGSQRARPSQYHIVQLYQNVEFLSEVVGLYLQTGLEQGEGEIVVATAPHWRAFLQHLKTHRGEVTEAQARGQLIVLDAEDVLARIMPHRVLEEATFTQMIGGAIEEMRGPGRFRQIRIYGELVNLLWEQRQIATAIRLEELWNGLAASQPFSLLCAYRMDNFSTDVHGPPLQGLCRTHSHLLPTEDDARLEQAVYSAMTDILGVTQANTVRRLLKDRRLSAPVMPDAQVALVWLKDNLPIMANAILVRAERYYTQASPRGGLATS